MVVRDVRLVRHRPRLFAPGISDCVGDDAAPEVGRAGVVLLEADLPPARVPLEQLPRDLVADPPPPRGPHDEEVADHLGLVDEALHERKAPRLVVDRDQITAAVGVVEVPR